MPLLPEQTLILIGYRGSGKTTVGRCVAAMLKRDFVDLDERIEQALGCTVHDIFALHGEPAFRQHEATALAGELGKPNRVLSVGGGAVVSAENRRRMKAAGVCVWLTAPPAELLRRLQADPRSPSLRPALTAAAEPLAEIEQVLSARAPHYGELADMVIDTRESSVEQVAAKIAARV